MINDITAITVYYNTYDIFVRMYKAFRSFHPEMHLMIIDCSDEHPLGGRPDDNASVFKFRHNIGHGRGLNYAISKVCTPFVLIMDTDTVILKDPLPEMIALMDDNTYGVGCVTEVGYDGYDFGALKHHRVPVKYLHPFFALIRVEQYNRYHPFVHHGAPWYKAAVHIHNKGRSHILKHFDGLRAFDYAADGTQCATTTDYVMHDFGGTRQYNKRNGKHEVELGWTL